MNINISPTHYQIRLQGCLDERWARWFEGLEISLRPEGETVLSGELDQAALHGVLSRIRDLGLTLISVQRVSSPDDQVLPHGPER